MGKKLRKSAAGIGTILMASCLATSAGAQGLGPGVSLGGYGASATLPDPGMGGTGTIPFAGKFGGFMPSRMGGGPLSFSARPPSGMGTTRSSSGLSSPSDGMGRGAGSRARMAGPFGSRGAMGAGTSGGGGMGAGRPGVMPPSIGYPFRRPRSLLTPAGSGPGMSM